ncbi:hypothetical protein C8R45DRAFT_197681 [Mycena sanguinolenta]|nr:hypothetical protein C8R45DRAFT_197681 [Mycena sanguinolenta]
MMYGVWYESADASMACVCTSLRRSAPGVTDSSTRAALFSTSSVLDGRRCCGRQDLLFRVFVVVVSAALHGNAALGRLRLILCAMVHHRLRLVIDLAFCSLTSPATAWSVSVSFSAPRSDRHRSGASPPSSLGPLSTHHGPPSVITAAIASLPAL